ncbi:heterokaryon incompatibility protein [Diplodia corticola]|uniref:Heterokaryon incompatibility protein n=1 Tax=Diplodia corticola TaxID=236234 RepID=A0A1J9QS76_9PEZI|nr:heterokaryon incompatibility protein [Diplodia corticola]OJD31814.1 heterokaryon incompatibility protein [Diplodia corticola]
MIPVYQLPVPVSSTFQHRPLTDPRHIRLLRLHPGHFALRKDAPWLIEYEIVHVSLDAAPAFEAVSYVWGSSAKSHMVRILPTNRTLAITEALIQVLAHLNKSSTTGYLWIDQLCINQDDELERNHQVSMMGDIYSKAKRTLVWLGEPDAHSNLVVGTLDIVGDRSKDFAFRRSRKEAALQGKKDVAQLRMHLQHALNRPCSVHSAAKGDMMDMDDQDGSMGEEDPCHQCFEEAATDRVKAACGVMSRPWEVLLAKEVYMMIGDTKLSPCDFHRAIHANLQAPKSIFGKVEYNMDEAPGLRPLSFLTYFWDSLDNNDIPIFSCILDDLRDGIASGYFKASNPRDVVYAFLGLHPRATQLIAPHYSWSVQDVYVDAAMAVVEETGNLDLLGICDSFYLKETTNGLPSWVPDWSRASLASSLFGPGRERGFCASGALKHAVQPGPRSRSLFVMGILIDRITAIHPQQYPRERPGYMMHNADDGGRRDSQAPDYLELGKTAEELTRARSPQFAPVTMGRILNLLLLKEQRLSDDCQYTWRDREEILYYAAGRQVAQGAGDPLALVPSPSAVGDVIWLLKGCPTPVVLRPAASGSGAYYLVGACYYEGAMHGQHAHLLGNACSIQLI